MSRTLTALLIALGGGAAMASGGYLAYRRMKKTTDAVENAVRTGGTVKIHATGYWPFTARKDERRMEGGIEGAASWRGHRVVDPRTGRRVQLHTLEQHLADPVKHPEVSLSGDPEVWPFGQRLALSPWPNAIFRVVDTGQHFTGSRKVFRVVGEEPIDICVDSSRTPVPKQNVTATIIPHDNWEGGQLVATAKLKDQIVTGAVNDTEALARAVESSCPRGTIEEKQAVAWACRNRAGRLQIPIAQVLAPEGKYGPRGSCGRDFVSTERSPSEESIKIARAVLSLPDEYDPTVGAIDFWCPKQQTAFAVLGLAHPEFAAYRMNEGEMRAALEAMGLRVCGIVGDLELLVA